MVSKRDADQLEHLKVCLRDLLDHSIFQSKRDIKGNFIAAVGVAWLPVVCENIDFLLPWIKNHKIC